MAAASGWQPGETVGVLTVTAEPGDSTRGPVPLHESEEYRSAPSEPVREALGELESWHADTSGLAPAAREGLEGAACDIAARLEWQDPASGHWRDVRVSVPAHLRFDGGTFCVEDAQWRAATAEIDSNGHALPLEEALRREWRESRRLRGRTVAAPSR